MKLIPKWLVCIVSWSNFDTTFKDWRLESFTLFTVIGNLGRALQIYENRLPPLKKKKIAHHTTKELNEQRAFDIFHPVLWTLWLGEMSTSWSYFIFDTFISNLHWYFIISNIFLSNLSKLVSHDAGFHNFSWRHNFLEYAMETRRGKSVRVFKKI